MEGRARLSSRGCVRIWPCAGVWLLGAWSDRSTRGGESASHPKSKLAARPWWVAAITRFADVELDSGVCLISLAAMKESHEAVLDSLGCRTDIDTGGRRLQ